MVVYEAAGDSVKVTVDGVDPQGAPTPSGRQVRRQGLSLTGDERRCPILQGDQRPTLQLTNRRRQGYPVWSNRSLCGRQSCTVTVSGTDPAGVDQKHNRLLQAVIGSPQEQGRALPPGVEGFRDQGSKGTFLPRDFRLTAHSLCKEKRPESEDRGL
jgi:hypothetical protein